MGKFIIIKKLIDKGYSFFSSSDTEVIIKSYHFWGKDCVKHLDGMFAFAIWDSLSKNLFIARDRMGIKPLYYNLTDKAFTFASNSQALLTQSLDKSINPIALQQQLSLHGVVPAPNTIINGIKKLRPGTFIILNENGIVDEQSYWYPNASRHESKEMVVPPGEVTRSRSSAGRDPLSRTKVAAPRTV